MTAEPLCRRWHLSLRNPGRSRPDAIIAEAVCRRWHLPLRNPAAAPPAQSPIRTDPLLLWLPAPSLGVTRWLDPPGVSSLRVTPRAKIVAVSDSADAGVAGVSGGTLDARSVQRPDRVFNIRTTTDAGLAPGPPAG
jgi:hypothetical protein